MQANQQKNLLFNPFICILPIFYLPLHPQLAFVMINREIIRIKVLQSAYAYYQNGDNNIETAEIELFTSLSKTYGLYNYLLALIVELTKAARRQLQKSLVTSKDEDESLRKFADNRFALQLESNFMLKDFINTQGNLWDEHRRFVDTLLRQIQETDIYKEYMTSLEDSYETDREVWKRLYRALIQDNDDLDQLFEEESVYWNNERDIVDTFVMKTIKRFDEKSKAEMPLLPEYDSADEREFARKLFRTAIMNKEEYVKYMSDVSLNWDVRRIAFMDVLIMQLAVAEMLTFQNIPLSVTINEYVDLAKTYSTPRSGGYVNGMLDAIAHNLVNSGRMFGKSLQK